MKEGNKMKEAVLSLINSINSGCSALTWEGNDHKHYWGRNFDFDRIANGSKITFLPRNLDYYTSGNELEQNIDPHSLVHSKYAVIGMGSTIMGKTPTMYEGVNECGLSGGQLYFRNFAAYEEHNPQKLNINPIYVVTYLLTMCSSVDDVIEHLQQRVVIENQPVFGNLSHVHWMFSDTSGKSIVIEPTKDGLKIYTDNIGVMTNSPSYDWHLQNLANYPTLVNHDIGDYSFLNHEIRESFSGTGSIGLPGDCSSPSRFVKLAFLKRFGALADNEEHAISRMFRMLNQVSFTKGLIEVENTGVDPHTNYGIEAYDYTVYSAIMCNESGNYYWISYENPTINCINLTKLLEETEIKQWDLDLESVTINYLN